MAVTISGITTEQLNTGGLDIQNEVIDGQFPNFAMLDAYKSAGWGMTAGNKSRNKGGSVLIHPVEFEDHSEPTELTSAALGYDPINQTVRPTITQSLQYTWWFCLYLMAISYREQEENKGPQATIDLTKARVENVQRAAMRRMDIHLTQGGQAGHTELNHFNGIDFTAGYLEAAEYTAQSHLVGTLSKATWNAYPLLLNQYYDFANSVNSRGYDGITLTMARMKTRYHEGGGKSFALASTSCAAALGRLAMAHVVMDSNAKDRDLAAPEIMIGGRKVTPSAYMPTAGTASTATPGSMYWITPEQQPFYWLGDNMWKLFGWEMRGSAQAVLTNMLVAAGQLCPKGLSGSALFVRGEQF